jgi:hypothetical protein
VSLDEASLQTVTKIAPACLVNSASTPRRLPFYGPFVLRSTGGRSPVPHIHPTPTKERHALEIIHLQLANLQEPVPDSRSEKSRLRKLMPRQEILLLSTGAPPTRLAAAYRKRKEDSPSVLIGCCRYRPRKAETGAAPDKPSAQTSRPRPAPAVRGL